MLMAIHELLNEKDLTQVVCYVALLTGFYLLLRKINLVPVFMTGKTGFDGNKQFQRKDLRIGSRTILADIKWSKTLQKTGCQLQLPLLLLMTKPICPIHWIKKMVRLIPTSPESPLFVIPKDGKLVPLTYKVLGDQLKEWAKKIKGTDQGWTLHGLR